MARHQRICKQFCTIQIKVTVNTPQILDVVKTSTANNICENESWNFYQKSLQDFEQILLGKFSHQKAQ